MLIATHLTIGARDWTHLIEDDADAIAFVDLVRGQFGERLLVYDVMTTHAHLVVEGKGDGIEAVCAAYKSAYDARHPEELVLRGKPGVHEKESLRELARAVDYVHENPVDAKLVERQVEHEASSAREFAGLSCRVVANVNRTRELLRQFEKWALPGWWEQEKLADLEPATWPVATPPLILGACAQAFRLAPSVLTGGSREPLVQKARAVFVVLGRLESYSDAQLGRALGKSRSRTTQLGGEPCDARDVRIVRTLLRESGFKRRLSGACAAGVSPVTGLALPAAAMPLTKTVSAS